jgi:Ni,Fe-hydrogenase III component G
MDVRERIRSHLGEKILKWQDNSPRRVYFTINKDDVVPTVKFLFKDLGLRFSIATGSELPEAFEIIYHFSFDPKGEFYSLRTFIPDKKNPEIGSITPLFPGAEWIEREIWEMLGIKFSGHPNLKRLLLADDWPEGKYPLRKKED